MVLLPRTYVSYCASNGLFFFDADKRRFPGGKLLSKWMRFSAPTPLMKIISLKPGSRRPLWMSRLLKTQLLYSNPAKSLATRTFNRSGWRQYNMADHQKKKKDLGAERR